MVSAFAAPLLGRNLWRGGFRWLTPPANVRRPLRVARNRHHFEKAASYTPLVIGALLKTENTGNPFDPATVPGLICSVHLDPHGYPVITFGKAGGHIDGVNLYMERGGLAVVRLGMFTHSPAVDTTPLLVPGTPEEQTYTVQPVINDVEVGLRSAPVSVVMK